MGYTLGIDIGTTYSAAAVWRDGVVETMSLGGLSQAIPSVIFVHPDGTVLVGDAANRRALTEPGRVAREFKRRIGDTAPLMLGGTPFSPQSLTGSMLRWIVEQTSQLEGGPPDKVTLTCPANWGDFKHDLLLQAARMADLGDVELLTEPEGAAIHYALQERVEPGSVVAVYDLGGGTFDSTVLRKGDAGFEVIGTPEGIEHLGGIDFDQAVFHHVLRSVGIELDELDDGDQPTVVSIARLREECVRAKEALSSDTSVSIPVVLPNLQTEVRLTRAEFEQMIRIPLSETIRALERTLAGADLTPQDVSAVLLVGGSSRIPIVSQMVSAEMGRPVAVDAHPKYSIARGAAFHAAAQLNAGISEEATDVAPLPATDTEAELATQAAIGAVAPVGAPDALVADAVTAVSPAGEVLSGTVAPPPVPSPPGGVGGSPPPGTVAPVHPDLGTAPSPGTLSTGGVPAGGSASPARPKRSPALVAGVAVVVVAIVAAGAFFALSGDGGDDPTNTTEPDVQGEASGITEDLLPPTSEDPPEELWRANATQDVSGRMVSLGDGQGVFSSDDAQVYLVDLTEGVADVVATIGGRVFSGPAVDESANLVAIGGGDGTLYAYNLQEIRSGGRNLTPQWTFPTEGQIDGAPAIADGIVVVGSNDRSVYGVNADTGLEEWRFPTGDAVHSSPTIVDGVVYIGSMAGLFAIDLATGDEVWSYRVEDRSIFFSRPLVSGGTVVVGTNQGYLLAVNAADGSLAWETPLGPNVGSSPAADEAGNIYVGSFDGSVYKVSPAGEVVWSVDTTGGRNAELTEAANADGEMTDEERTEIELCCIVFSSPAVADGVVYIGSHSNYLWAIDADSEDGSVLWRYNFFREMGAPVVVDDGHLYVGGDTQALTAFALPD